MKKKRMAKLAHKKSVSWGEGRVRGSTYQIVSCELFGRGEALITLEPSAYSLVSSFSQSLSAGLLVTLINQTHIQCLDEIKYLFFVCFFFTLSTPILHPYINASFKISNSDYNGKIEFFYVWFSLYPLLFVLRFICVSLQTSFLLIYHKFSWFMDFNSSY